MNQANIEISNDANNTAMDQGTKTLRFGYELKEKNAEYDIVKCVKQVHYKQVNIASKYAISSASEKVFVNVSKCDVHTVSFEENNDKHIHSGIPVKLLRGKSSGNLASELNEEVIDLIDKKTAEDSKTVTVLRKTASGHFFIDFNPVDTTGSYVCRISKKRSPSGSRLLEVKKDFIDLLKLKDKNKLENGIKAEEKAMNISDRNIKIKECQSEKPVILKNIGDTNIQPVKNIRNEDMLLEVKQNNEQNGLVSVKLETNTGECSKIEAPLVKTLSGNITIDLEQLLTNKKINLLQKEKPVSVGRSNLGAIILNINKDEAMLNASLKRINSKACILLLNYPEHQSEGSVKTAMVSDEKLYKLHIKTAYYNMKEPPAVLKSTPSQNYVVVPDKEFEVTFKYAVQDLFDNNKEYFVNVTSTDSDSVILNIDDSDEEQNALIISSASGDLYVKKIEESSIQDKQKKYSVEITSKVLDELLFQLPRTSKENITSNSFLQRTSTTSRKLISDLHLHEKEKLFIPNQKYLFSNQTPTLKEKNSGQYGLVVDKEPKSSIDNIKKYLHNDSQSLILINRTDKNENTLALSSEQNNTSSENIYVNTDEVLSYVNETIEATRLNVSDTNSKHVIRRIVKPVNRAVTTACNGVPGDCDFSKCVCSNIKFENLNWVFNPAASEKQITSAPSVFEVKSYVNESYEIYGHNKDTEHYPFSKSDCHNSPKAKALPHIVIKPCDRQSVVTKNRQINEQCFYVLEVGCPFQENPKSTDYVDENNVIANTEWDSLSFLPPQLPHFLKGYQY